MNRVAFLSRVSTMDQHDSMDNQEQILNQWLANHPNCVLYKKYEDEGISGAKGYKRKQWLEMIEDGQNKKFDILISKSFSRFGRNQTETLSAIKMLIAQGIRVIFLEDSLDSQDDMSKFGLFAWLAEQEAQKGSSRVKMVWKNYNKLGKVHVCIAPLGYDYDIKIKNFILNEKESIVIKDIFNLYLNGFGYNKIAQTMKEREIKTKKGGRWAGQTVATILRNPFYMGTLIQGKTETIDVTMRENKKNLRENWHYHENHHEAIISKETWEKVQAEMQKRSKNATKNRHSNVALFSSILRCADCGATMTIKRKKRLQNYKPYYQCINYDMNSLKSGHQSNFVWEDFIITLIENNLNKTVKNNFAEINKKIKIGNTTPDKNWINCKIKEIDNILVEEGKTGNTLVALLTSGKITMEQYTLQNDLIVNKINNLNTHKKKLTEELEIKDKTKEKQKEMKENIEQILNIPSDKWTNAMIRSIIDKIEVHTNGTIEVFYRYI